MPAGCYALRLRKSVSGCQLGAMPYACVSMLILRVSLEPETGSLPKLDRSRNPWHSKPDTSQCLDESPRTICARHSQSTSDSQGSLDQHTEKRRRKEKRSSYGALPRSSRRNVFDAPSIRLSLGRLRPRRAFFRFIGHSNSIIKTVIEHPRHA